MMRLPLSIAEELHQDLNLSISTELLTSYLSPKGVTCLAFRTPRPEMVAFNLGLLMAEWQPSQTEWEGGTLTQLVNAFCHGDVVRLLTEEWILFYDMVEVTP